MKVLLVILALLQSPILFATSGNVVETLTIYTARKTQLMEPLVKRYSAVTGVKVITVDGAEGPLIERIKREGARTTADIFMAVDAGNLWYAAEQDILSPLSSAVLTSAIPPAYRDEKGRWFGFSLRARTLFYNPNLVQASELSTYEALADKKFKGRLCLRTSNKVYNQSLVASLIDRLGAEQAEKVVQGWVANLAKPVFTSDSLLLEAIDRGDCQVGIANTYYLARLVKTAQVKNVKPFWPNQEDSGVHVNISGAGILKHGKNKEAAKRFIEWMATDEAQQILADADDEYPVKQGVPVSTILAQWGSFKKDERPMNVYGKLQKQAIQLMDKVNYR